MTFWFKKKLKVILKPNEHMWIMANLLYVAMISILNSWFLTTSGIHKEKQGCKVH